LAQRPEHAPGETSTAAGAYEQLNIFGQANRRCYRRQALPVLRFTFAFELCNEKAQWIQWHIFVRAL
jgi:hypothetical protein